jgi:CheY-like chemotaxis protein
MTKILIADDDAAWRNILRRMLSERGFEVLEAADGREAIEAVERLRPDVVLLDLLMPETNGFSVCHHIKTTPEIAGVKVVVVSAKFYLADRLLAQKLGADRFLTKPLDQAVLLDTLRELAGS